MISLNQHERGCLKGPVYDWNLALVELEVDNFPWFTYFAGQFSFYGLLEFLFRQFSREVCGGEIYSRFRRWFADQTLFSLPRQNDCDRFDSKAFQRR